jgi:hypothetical protein
MKKISYFLVLTLIVISFSCSDNIIDTPIPLEKSNLFNSFGDGTVSITKTIDGAIGGEILLDTTIIDLSGNLVIVHSRLIIDSGSFKGVREITMVPNVNSGSIQFFPEMNFNLPIRLQLEYAGINLTRLGFSQNSIVKFVFIKEELKAVDELDSNYEPVDYSFCQINWPQQSLRVSNAKLNHFSRYSFIR